MDRSNFMLILMYRDWIRYILPSIFVFVAVLMFWWKHFNKGRPLEPFRITPPHNRNAVEQLLTLQEAITQVEALLRAGNIVLLKLRALLFAVLPQVCFKAMPICHLAKLVTIGYK